MVCLNKGNYLPYDRLSKVSKDIFGIPASCGTLVTIVHECGKMLDGSMEYIKDQLKQAKVLHVDETGNRVKENIGADCCITAKNCRVDNLGGICTKVSIYGSGHCIRTNQDDRATHLSGKSATGEGIGEVVAAGHKDLLHAGLLGNFDGGRIAVGSGNALHVGQAGFNSCADDCCAANDVDMLNIKLRMLDNTVAPGNINESCHPLRPRPSLRGHESD